MTAGRRPAARPGHSARNGQRDPGCHELRLARTMRWPGSASGIRNARAICGVSSRRPPAASARAGPPATAPDGSRRRVGASRSSAQGAAPPGRAAARKATSPLCLSYASSASRCAATWSHAAGRSGGRSRPARSERLDHGRLDRLLSEAEVAEPTGQRGRQQARLLAQGPARGAGPSPSRSFLELRVVLDHRADLEGHAGELSGGAALAMSTAASRSGTSMNRETDRSPPSASSNGPSTTSGPTSPCFTVVAVVTGCSSAPPSVVRPAAPCSWNHWYTSR